MNYFQKVIIKSNVKLSRLSWTQNEEDIWIDTLSNECNGDICLYRKFNSYKDDNIDLYFGTDTDTYNISFQISNIYKCEIKINLTVDPVQNKVNLYIDDKYYTIYN
jgi:hypothetical protein